MKIRKAKKSDLRQIAEIYRTAYSEKPYNEKWSAKNAKTRILSCFKNCSLLVVEDKKEGIVGFSVYFVYNWEKGKTGYIDDLVVKKGFRGKGIGKELMGRVEEELKKKKVKEICLESNPKSRVFSYYKRKGYKDKGWIAMAKIIK